LREEAQKIEQYLAKGEDDANDTKSAICYIIYSDFLVWIYTSHASVSV
jgi:hypothetical protein